MVDYNEIDKFYKRLDLDEKNIETVVTAMWENENSILIAANSCKPALKSQKVQSHKTLPLAWGTVGNQGLGQRFDDWLSSKSTIPGDIYGFMWDIAGEISQLNGKQRQQLKTARVEETWHDMASVLVVGYGYDKPFILSVDDKGNTYVCDREREFRAIGERAMLVARILYAAYKNGLMIDMSSEERMNYITNIAAGMGVMAYDPAHMLRVTRSGVEDITNEKYRNLYYGRR